MNRAQMDNHMLEIARLFGVELDEEFEITWSNGVRAIGKFTAEDGFVEKTLGTWIRILGAFEEILLGKAKIMKLNQATMTEDDE